MSTDVAPIETTPNVIETVQPVFTVGQSVFSIFEGKYYLAKVHRLVKEERIFD
jgi:hypothetical protein